MISYKHILKGYSTKKNLSSLTYPNAFPDVYYFIFSDEQTERFLEKQSLSLILYNASVRDL